MSEVTEAHSSTDGVSNGGPHEVDDEGSESYSGYLCGVCEEPLPYGAATCIACGTPVAPLDDEEMVAGPYVFNGPETGEPVAIAVEDDPYAPPGDEEADATAVGEDDQQLRGADASGQDADALDGAGDRPAGAPRPAPIAVTPYEPGPPASGNGAGDHDAEAHGGDDEPIHTAQPAQPVQPSPVAIAGDPADALGLERTPHAWPTVSDPGPDPMLGRAPTAPVLSPPPPLPSEAPQAPAPPGLSSWRAQQPAAGAGGGRRERSAAESKPGPVTPLVVGAVVVVLALLAGGAFIASRGGTDSAGTAPSTTVAGPPAPSPTARAPVVSQPNASTTRAPDVALFCVAANQFRLDPNPDSVAAKFLAKPEQLTNTIEVLVANAPADVRPQLIPLENAVNDLATRVNAGEITTVTQLRAAVDGATLTPAWPRFDQAIAPAVMEHC